MNKQHLSAIQDYCKKLRYLFETPHPEITKEQGSWIAEQATEYYEILSGEKTGTLNGLRNKRAEDINKKLRLSNLGNILFYLRACDFVARELIGEGNTTKVDETMNSLYYYRKCI